MNYREVEIFSPADLGTTGTKVIDINIEDSLSAIELLWQTTVVTVSDMTAPHPACISKVELVDGSDVLVSLSGEELQALCFYTMGYMPLDEITVVVGDYMRSAMPIYFGRYLYDPELAFDPKKFKNPQLKVTWDEDAANASVVANELTVRGMAFDEKKINPIGMLTSKEIKSYTPVASGYEYTTMPTDHPYRFLMIQSEATDKNPFEVMAQIKLHEEHEKRVPFNMTGYEIFRKLCQPLGPISQNVRLNETAADANAIHATPTYGQVVNVDYDDDVVAANDEHIQAAWAGCIVTVGATVNKVPYRALITGYAPHFCMGIPFGRLDDIGDFYDVTKLGHLELVNQGASAVGTTPAARICLQQMRRY